MSIIEALIDKDERNILSRNYASLNKYKKDKAAVITRVYMKEYHQEGTEASPPMLFAYDTHSVIFQMMRFYGTLYLDVRLNNGKYERITIITVEETAHYA